jgi:hypothetical protein
VFITNILSVKKKIAGLIRDTIVKILSREIKGYVYSFVPGVGPGGDVFVAQSVKNQEFNLVKLNVSMYFLRNFKIDKSKLLENECNTLLFCEHPNIIKPLLTKKCRLNVLLRLCFNRKWFCSYMYPFTTGNSLEEILKMYRIDLSIILSLAYQLSKTTEYLHGKRIFNINYDLKALKVEGGFKTKTPVNLRLSHFQKVINCNTGLVPMQGKGKKINNVICEDFQLQDYKKLVRLILGLFVENEPLFFNGNDIQVEYYKDLIPESLMPFLSPGTEKEPGHSIRRLTQELQRLTNPDKLETAKKELKKHAVQYLDIIENEEGIKFIIPVHWYEKNAVLGVIAKKQLSVKVDFDIKRLILDFGKSKSEAVVLFSTLNKIPVYTESEYIHCDAPLVSCIIVLTANDLFVYGHLIPSILRNSRQFDIEIIIVYNGKGADLSLFSDFKLIRSEYGWVSKAYNKGAEAAKGKYLAFFHDDCMLSDPEWIPKCLKLLSGKVTAVSPEINDKNIFFQAAKCVPLVISSVQFRGLGGFDETFYCGLEDVDFTLNLYQKKRQIARCGFKYFHFNGMSTLLFMDIGAPLFKKLFYYHAIPKHILSKKVEKARFLRIYDPRFEHNLYHIYSLKEKIYLFEKNKGYLQKKGRSAYTNQVKQFKELYKKRYAGCVEDLNSPDQKLITAYQEYTFNGERPSSMVRGGF